MEKKRRKEPVLGRLLLSGMLGGAILAGFVTGLQVGDRKQAQRPVSARPEIPVLWAAAATLPVAAAEETPVIEEMPRISRQQIMQGVEYLATHNRWNRDEMEQMPALRGLWDSINTYSLDDIRRYNGLLASMPLTSIVEGLEQTPMQGCYAAKADNVITLSTYIKRLRQTD